jgi:hypothetical protein
MPEPGGGTERSTGLRADPGHRAVDRNRCHAEAAAGGEANRGSGIGTGKINASHGHHARTKWRRRDARRSGCAKLEKTAETRSRSDAAHRYSPLRRLAAAVRREGERICEPVGRRQEAPASQTGVHRFRGARRSFAHRQASNRHHQFV